MKKKDPLLSTNFSFIKWVFLILLLELISNESTKAQRYSNMNMLNHRGKYKLIQLTNPFYNEIIVVDNRFDSTIIPDMILDEGFFVPTILHGSASGVIKEYIEKITTGLVKKTGTILLELRRFEFNFNGVYLFVNAYCKIGDSSYVKIASMDTVFRTQWDRYITGEAFDVFLKKLDKNKKIDTSILKDRYSIKLIQNNNIQNEWSKIPINNSEKFSDGIFENFNLFLNGKTEKFNLNLIRLQDSSYELFLKDSLPDEKMRINRWLISLGGQGFIAFKNKLYYMMLYPICLPLTKKGNTFYFHIPYSLPNMYYFNLAKQIGLFSELNLPTPYNGASLGITTGSVLLGSIIKEKRIKKLIQKGIEDSSRRDCYIDLETGIIKY